MSESKKTVTFVLLKPKMTGALPQRMYPISKSISPEDYVMVDGEPRQIAYVKGESSCFPDNWRNPKAPLGEAPEFVNGYLTIPVQDKCKIEFMRLNNRNAANTDKIGNARDLYKELDLEKEVGSALDKERLKNQAATAFFELASKPDEIRAVARKLGLYGDGKIFQMSVMDYSKKNPKEFLEIVSDPRELDYAVRLDLIYQASSKGILVYNNGRWFWRNGEEAIIAVPKGADRFDYLTGWTFADQEGLIFWKSLSPLVSGRKEGEKDVVPALSAKEYKELEGMTNSEVFAKCRQFNIIFYNQEIKRFQFDDGSEVYDLGFSKKDAIDWLSDVTKDKVVVIDDIKARLIIALKAL